MSPDGIIAALRGIKVRIAPTVETSAADGVQQVACDCSGCSSPDVYVDVLRPPREGSAEAVNPGAPVRGRIVMRRAEACQDGGSA